MSAAPDMVPPAGGAILERDDLRVHIVGHGDREEKQHQGEAEGAPFLEAMPDPPVPLMDPLRSPGSQQGYGDQEPQEIKE
jgi:hypothetical protein